MALTIRPTEAISKPPKNRNCRRKGCDGKYFLIMNDWNCIACGHGPYKTRVATKEDSKEVRKAKLAIARFEREIAEGLYSATETAETPEAAQDAFSVIAGDSMLVPETEHEPEDPPARKTHTDRYYDSSGNLYAKQCSYCRTIKPACDFDVRLRYGKQKIQSRCRDCLREVNHAYYESRKADKDSNSAP